MSFEIEAVYENGAFKLDRLLPLQEHQRVRIVVQDESNISRHASIGGDWWQALQDVLADQKKRGFVGTISGIDRSDEGYDERMRDILGNTINGGANG